MKEPYNDTSNPNVIITEPAPGNFVILGHRPQSRFVEGEGHIVPSQSSEIPQEVPTSALLWILSRRGVNVGAQVEVVKGAATPVFEPAKESLSGGIFVGVEDAVIAVLNGETVRIAKLSEMTGFSPEEIKASSGNKYEIASGGWVKPKTEEAAQ